MLFPAQPVTTVVLFTPEERAASGRKWLYVLTMTYVYRSEEYEITVPAGFQFDGASVPRAAWSLVGLTPDGPIRAAACIHDWLYRHDGNPPGILPEGFRMTRAEADKLFHAMMLRVGIRKAQARLAYWAVRIGARRW